MDSQLAFTHSRSPSVGTEPSEQRRTVVHAGPAGAAPPPSSAASSSAAAEVDISIVNPRDDDLVYHSRVLSNSLRCLLIGDPNADKGAVSLSVQAGYFCDEEYLPGLAHFLQTMMVYGNTLYDDFLQYVSKNKGSIKVSTLTERSSFCYDIDNMVLPSSLVRFANFFVEPTIYSDTPLGGRVINFGSDDANSCSPLDQIQRKLTEAGTPFHNFCQGNWLAVADKAKEKGLNIEEELHRFYNSYYSASRMTLVVYAKENLDDLLSLIETKFGAINNSESKSIVFPCHPCKGFLQILVKVSPINGGRSLRLEWPLARNVQKVEEVDACSYVTHVFGLKGEGSLYSSLKNRGWGTLSAIGERNCNAMFSFFVIHIELTSDGHEHFEDIVGLIFNYIKMLKKERPRKYLFNQRFGGSKLKEIREADFCAGRSGNHIEQVDTFSSNMLIYPPEKWLSGSSLLSVYSVKAIERIVNELSPERVRMFLVSGQFEDHTLLEDTLHDTKFAVIQVPPLSIKEWMKNTSDEKMCLPTAPMKAPGFETVERKASAVLQLRQKRNTAGEKAPGGSQLMPIRAVRDTRQRTKTAREKGPANCSFQQIPALDGTNQTGLAKDDSVCIIYDVRMIHNHLPPLPGYDEVPERLSAIHRRLENDKLLDRCTVYESERAPLTYIVDVHDDDYVTRIIKGQCNPGADTGMYFGDDSEEAIFLAAGGALKASRMVAMKKHQHAFALVRPPGHHARPAEELGFCYFNNIAIAAKYLKREHKMPKIFILDWDIHNGNGTSETFYDDKDVLFVSLHRKSLFPRSKDIDDSMTMLGSGDAEGYNCNFCWFEDAVNDDDLFAVMNYLVLPLAKDFQPDIILISAGFDAAKGDSIGDCSVSPRGYATALNKLLELDKGLVLVLEGGYTGSVLGKCCSSCVRVLSGDMSEVKDTAEYHPLESTWDTILKIRELLKPYWAVFNIEIPAEVLSKSRKHPIPKNARIRKQHGA